MREIEKTRRRKDFNWGNRVKKKRKIETRKQLLIKLLEKSKYCKGVMIIMFRNGIHTLEVRENRKENCNKEEIGNKK